MRWILPALLLMGCPVVGENAFDKVKDADGDGFDSVRFGGPDCMDNDPSVGNCDVDGDGVFSEAAGGPDCDDNDASAYPDNEERCDDIDHDCDGDDTADAVDRIEVFVDEDGDGFGAGEALLQCGAGDEQKQAPPGYSLTGSDCDDEDNARYPGVEEHCDGVDNDCDGVVNEGAEAFVGQLDEDEDGFGGGASLGLVCPEKGVVPFQELAAFLDCDDTNPLVNPNQVEVYYNGVDENCSGMEDEYDADGDGSPRLSADGPDCDDTNSSVFPGNVEVCDTLDNDCNELIDDGVGQLVYEDLDGDGWGSAVARQFCTVPGEGWVSSSNDCDDTDAAVFFGAPEVYYDGIDQNCSLPLLHDDDDLDGDGFPISVDCDDTNSGVHPDGSATLPDVGDACDGIDNDCDGLIDEADDDVPPSDVAMYYLDEDGDGYGGVQERLFCQNSVSPGFVPAGGDCNDSSLDIHPGAVEIPYDNVDQACNGDEDEDDLDGDGFKRGVDCNDDDYTIFPGAGEHCDDVDSDCDGLSDDFDDDIALEEKGVFYRDFDHDGFGEDASVIVQCPGDTPLGYIELGGDCDDLLFSVSPAATEVCDGIDNDCNEVVDDALQGLVTLYADADGDQFGALSKQALLCPNTPGFVENSVDCDDQLATVFPGALEVCGDGVAQDCNHPEAALDCDGDGFNDSFFDATGTDCDDSNAMIYPGAPEICDSIDNNCSGLVDVEDPTVDLTTTSDYFADLDNDGYGDPGVILAQNSCVALPDAAGNGDDCDDSNSAIHPNADEYCNEVDDDCDGVADELPVVDPVTFYRDADGDGVGTSAVTLTESCEPEPGWVANAGDCDDTKDYVQVLRWYRDNDGDGVGQLGDFEEDCSQPPGFVADSGDCDDNDPLVGSGEYYLDSDADGYGDASTLFITCDPPIGAVVIAGDCNDLQAFISPDAAEVCDGIDNDCDGTIDDADSTVSGRPQWYLDSDSDNFGNPAVFVASCVVPPGYVGNADDCDDLDSLRTVDTYFLDNDGDGYGQEDPIYTCTQLSDYALFSGDCDDNNSLRAPDQPELCGDGVDNDCDGFVDSDDPELETTLWYRDLDGDGQGDVTDAVASCEPVVGRVSNATDCDDLQSTVYVGADERCDGVDNDCDGLIDDEDLPIGAPVWFADADNDGFGDEDEARFSCLPYVDPANISLAFVSVAQDCDDTNAAINPDQAEICDGLDNDCNLIVDDVSGSSLWFADVDGDSFGDPSNVFTGGTCDTQPIGYVANQEDCFDNDVLIKPGGVELCDGIDNDCDGLTDNNVAEAALLPWYADVDGDGYGIEQPVLHTVSVDFPTAIVNACSQPPGYVFDHRDCDDTQASISPAANEVCDSVDNDCDNQIDDEDNDVDAPVWFKDLDDDGYGTSDSLFACEQPPSYAPLDGDCNDDDANKSPGIVEPWYDDSDGDLQGDPNQMVLVSSCDTPPAGFVQNNNDCGPTRSDVHVGATETCDGVDQDCNGYVDDVPADGMPLWYADVDRDGYGISNTLAFEPALGFPSATLSACAVPAGYVADHTDCADMDGGRHPLAPEVCDSLDNDCDNKIDDEDDDVVGAPLWFSDVDSDGYGDPGTAQPSCVAYADVDNPTVVWVNNQEDCNDTYASLSPGFFQRWYADTDGDGAGDPSNYIEVDTCSPEPVGFEINNTDCDDTNSAINPATVETCDGVDNNCDGLIDNNILDGTDVEWFADVDHDGFGVADTALFTTGGIFDVRSKFACTAPPGYVLDNTDCDDTHALANPVGVFEFCDDLDNDCDGFVDGADLTGPSEAQDYFGDFDGDGYYGGVVQRYCPDDTIPADAIEIHPGDPQFDCNDGIATINPGELEQCGDTSDLDEDCSGNFDDGFDVVGGFTTFLDLDGDGVRGSQSSQCDLTSAQPDEGDCDDHNPQVHPALGTIPAALERCDGIDNDCDGQVDVGNLDITDPSTHKFTVYDGDGDGFGDHNPQSFFYSCELEVPGFLPATDCDDLEPDVHPNAVEVCDGIDNNCRGGTDEADPELIGGFGDPNTVGNEDADNDGYVRFASSCAQTAGLSPAGDCNEIPDIGQQYNPGQTDHCGEDYDCDGRTYYNYNLYRVGEPPRDFATISEALNVGCDYVTLSVQSGYQFSDSASFLGVDLVINSEDLGPYRWIQEPGAPALTVWDGSNADIGNATFSKTDGESALLRVEPAGSLGLYDVFLNAEGVIRSGSAPAQMLDIEGTFLMEGGEIESESVDIGAGKLAYGNLMFASNHADVDFYETTIRSFDVLGEVKGGATVTLEYCDIFDGEDGLQVSDFGSAVELKGSRVTNIADNVINSFGDGDQTVVDSLLNATGGLKHQVVGSGSGEFNLKDTRIINTLYQTPVGGSNAGVALMGDPGTNASLWEISGVTFQGGRWGIYTKYNIKLLNSVFTGYGSDPNGVSDGVFSQDGLATLQESLFVEMSTDHCVDLVSNNSGGPTVVDVKGPGVCNGSMGGGYSQVTTAPLPSDFHHFNPLEDARFWNLYPVESRFFDTALFYLGGTSHVGLSGSFLPVWGGGGYGDSDFDGMLDIDEFFWFGGTYRTDDYWEDWDSDGVSNGDELNNNTDPLDSGSY